MTQNPPADTTLLMNLTTDDVFTAQMALHYADRVLETGYPVTLFLNVRAVTLADGTIPQHTPGVTETSPHDRLRSLLDRGATIYACKQCSKQAGVDEGDWLDGIEPGGPDLVHLQMDPDTKVMTY
jgi:predicted peroxiredoxin